MDKGLSVGDVEFQCVSSEPWGAGHLQVESCYNGSSGAVSAVPVAHDQTLPAPFLPEHLIEILGVLAARHAIDAIVRRHKRTGLGVPNSNLEGQRVNLTQRPLGDDALHRHAPVLLIIAQEVLDGGLDSGALDATDESRGTKASEEGIFANGLESSSTERGALHVDSRAEDHMGTLGDGLLAHHLTCLFEQRLVECGT